MTNHPGSDELNAYLDGQVAPKDARRIEVHLSGCSQCAAALGSLGATAERLRDLPPVAPTPDEHRELRQAILSSRSPVRAGWFSSLQWGLAGGLVLVLIASIGFLLGPRGPESATEADLSVDDGSAGQIPELGSPAEVEAFVNGLPEVASAGEGPQTLSRQSAGAGSGGGDGGSGGPAGGSGDYAGATNEAEAESGELDGSRVTDAPESLTEEAPGPSVDADEGVASQPPATCADRLAALLSDPAALLTELDVVYRGEPALLAVYALEPPDGGDGYDRIHTLIVRSRDCSRLTGSDLEEAILYRSESRL